LFAIGKEIGESGVGGSRRNRIEMLASIGGADNGAFAAGKPGAGII
jgi:hypothetical protein